MTFEKFSSANCTGSFLPNPVCVCGGGLEHKEIEILGEVVKAWLVS